MSGLVVSFDATERHDASTLILLNLLVDSSVLLSNQSSMRRLNLVVGAS